jgi:FAD/FMN-containing dehydrogenase
VELIVNLSTQRLKFSIRGGGHGYTCQSTKKGGFIIDMGSFQDFEVIETNHIPFMRVGAGVIWSTALAHLSKRDLITVHGQCTSVGIAGFSLHGIYKLYNINEA